MDKSTLNTATELKCYLIRQTSGYRLQAFTMLPLTHCPVALDMQGTNKQGAVQSLSLVNLDFIDSNLKCQIFLHEFWDVCGLHISVYVCHIIVHPYLHSMLKSYFRQ